MYRLLAFAPNFYFDVVVEFVGGVAFTIEADVLGFGGIAVDEQSEACFVVWLVAAFAEFGRVIVVVVVECGDAFIELGIV